MFLSKNEIQEMTAYSRPNAQARWLAKHAFPFEIGADGHPRVLTTYIENRFGANSTLSHNTRQRHVEPNFTALKK